MTEVIKGAVSSPVFVAVIWPLIFAIIEVASTALLSDRTRASGAQIYRVWYQDRNGNHLSSAPVDIHHIVELHTRGSTIVNIKRLVQRMRDLFLFGLDLCIGALATDLALAFAATSENPTLARILVSVSVLHLAILVLVLVILKFSRSETRAIWSANAIGVLSIVTPLLLIGGQIAR